MNRLKQRIFAKTNKQTWSQINTEHLSSFVLLSQPLFDRVAQSNRYMEMI